MQNSPEISRPSDSYNMNSIGRSMDNNVLEEKARKSEEKRNALVEKANNDVAEFYKQRTESKEKNFKLRRQEEKEFLVTKDLLEKSGKSWDLVGSHINFKSNIGVKDTSRMKKVLIDLKN